MSIGEVSLDWADNDVTRKLSDDAPVLGIVHSLVGRAHKNAGFMHYAANRGWRTCVLNRRGHGGMPLRAAPYFNILGNLDDTVIMVKKMRERYPNNFMALAGMSAGGGHLISYIGREGDRVPVDAAASVCPVWDVKMAIRLMRDNHPFVDRLIRETAKNRFLEKEQNQNALKTMPDTLKRARQARSTHELLDAIAPFAGCQDLEHFYEENNPMTYFHGNKTPCLLLSSLDDFICQKEMIAYDDVRTKAKNYVLLTTDEGSHVAYNEGPWGQGSYMWRVTLDFFDTIRCLRT